MNLEIGYVGTSRTNCATKAWRTTTRCRSGRCSTTPPAIPTSTACFRTTATERVPATALQQPTTGCSRAQPAEAKFNFTPRLQVLEVSRHPRDGVDGERGRIRVPEEHLRPGQDIRNFNYAWPHFDRTKVVTASYSWQLGNLTPGTSPTPSSAAGRSRDLDLHQRTRLCRRPPTRTNFGMTGTMAGGIPISAAACRAHPRCPPSDPHLRPDGECSGRLLLNPSCFSAPTPGNNGSYIFPYIRASPTRTTTSRLSKNFNIGSKGHKLQFRGRRPTTSSTIRGFPGRRPPT